MALDHALALCLQADEGVVRLYSWARPTVSFGRNEPARGRYTSEGAAAAGVDLVRRPTGGRAVVHARELTYAVVAPVGTWGGLREAYYAIHRALAFALRNLGVPAEVGAGGGAAPPLRPDAGPCFRAPAAGEIVALGRKLVGSAQARFGRALLQHGSILLDDDQPLLARLGPEAFAAGVAPATLRDLIGQAGIDELAEEVARSLVLALGGRWREGAYRPGEISEAERLEAERYALDTWTWRR
jgi:lipoate-protein ligase A